MKQNFPVGTWQKMSLWLFLGLLAYMPVHIFVSTWIGTSFGVLEFMRVAKEGVLAVGAGIALVLAFRRGIAQELCRDKLIWLIGAFIGLNALLGVAKPTDADAELLGLVYNVRFLIYFVWGWLLTRLYAPENIRPAAIKIVLALGGVVVVCGLFQYLLLPDDALRHVGYARSNGVLPAFFIDDKPDLERIMSTVRDPNSLGSYLLIILGFVSTWALMAKQGNRKVRYMVFSALTLLAIFWTFSRAAWIGAVVTIAVAMFFVTARQRVRLRVYKTPVLFALAIGLVVLVSGLIMMRDSYLVKNVVLHADESTVMADPNELRLRFWRESFEDIASQPLGSGPGTAGLASIRNDKKTVLNENYYLQTAQETGIVGFALFVSILVMVVMRLLVVAKRHHNLAAMALIASFAGLVVTNFLAHIWANEAVAYTWWGLAGLLMVLAFPAKKSAKSS